LSLIDVINDFNQYFSWPNVQLQYFFIYFAIAAVIAFYLVKKSKTKYRIELFFISFYLLTGNINELLTIKIPGISFFEIQPTRFVYLMLGVFIIRKTFFSAKRQFASRDKRTPLFILALYAFVGMLVISVMANIGHIGVPDGIKVILDATAFLILVMAIGLMKDMPSYELIGKSIIVGAVITSFVSFIQVFIDPYFLRIGDARLAFGTLLRPNGLFDAEYSNSYYLITAIVWTLITVKKNSLKVLLVSLFSLAIISTFMRMSWIILIVVLLTYLLFIHKVAIEKLLLAAFAGLVLVLSLSIFFYQDFMKSSFVQERLTETVEGRKGYYSIVYDNIGKKPLFGYGDLKHEVYYVNMLRITSSRDRADGVTGGFHSTYFSVLFLYGIPAFVCFTLFVILTVVYFAQSYKRNLYLVLPFMVGLLYMVGNLTNTFLFLSYLSVIYAIHIGIGIGINNLREESEN